MTEDTSLNQAPDGSGEPVVRPGSKSTGKGRRKAGEPRAGAPRSDPRLQAYFANATLSAPAFLKALSGAKVAKFEDEDVAEAERLRSASDRDHRRLLALATQPNLPSRVSHWLWPKVLAVVRTRVPSAFEPYDIEPALSLQRLQREVARDMTSEVVEVRQAATNTLLLGLCWIVVQRNIDLSLALQTLGQAFVEGEKAVRVNVRRLLTSGKLSDVERAVAVSKAMGRQASEAADQRDIERAQRNAAEERLDEARRQVVDLQRDVTSLRSKVAILETHLEESRKELDDGKQHWGHDMVDVKSRQTALLREKVIPLLNDAVDALEIEPAVPRTALRRIKSVLVAVREEES